MVHLVTKEPMTNSVRRAYNMGCDDAEKEFKQLLRQKLDELKERMDRHNWEAYEVENIFGKLCK